MDFKARAHAMSDEEFRQAYASIQDVMFERPTDLNKASIEKILRHTRGPRVLEVGIGKGFLTLLLSKTHQTTGVDIIIQDDLRRNNPGITFHEANIEKLSFADGAFDTVICTHTLEHVLNINLAVNELRRVGKRLIVVVPRQRPYKYTFDLHLNFFPYPYSLVSALGSLHKNFTLEDADGDIFYMEDVA